VRDPSGVSGRCGREWRVPRHLGIFYMTEIYDMGPTALLPLRRKACSGFFRCITYIDLFFYFILFFLKKGITLWAVVCNLLFLLHTRFRGCSNLSQIKLNTSRLSQKLLTQGRALCNIMKVSCMWCTSHAVANTHAHTTYPLSVQNGYNLAHTHTAIRCSTAAESYHQK